MQNLEILADRLKHFRIEKNLKRKEVAARLNITTSAISYWETGKRIPDADTLLEICKLYDIQSIGQLFGNSEQVEITPLEHQLIDLFRQVDSTGKEATIKMLKGWIKA